MWSIIKGLFGAASTATSVATGGWIKYVIGAVAIAAAIFGVYEWGSSHGYQQGYQVAWNAQQKTIQGMVDKQNQEAQAQNDKITKLEQNASDALQKVQDAQAQIGVERDNAVAAYKKAHPQVAASCGVSPDTVNVINQMLGVSK
jgi:hypothetical protein